MSADVKAAVPEASHARVAPQLRLASFNDYEAIAHVGSANLLRTGPFQDWQRLWLDSPLWSRLGKDWPMGWLLETASGEIVGTFMNLPSLYKFRGHDLICGNSRAWAVMPEYRGYALWLIDEYFNQTTADLCVSTTAGPTATPVVDRCATRIPRGAWDAYSYWLIGYPGLVRDKLRRQRVPLSKLVSYPAGLTLSLAFGLLSKPLPKLAGGFSIEAADRFDSRFDAFWDELVRQNPEKLIAERSGRALLWHFGVPMRAGRLWIFTASRDRRLRAYCVFTRIGEGVRCSVRLVDYQTLEPDADLLPGFLRVALRRCSQEDIHVLENYGRGVPKMRAFDECAPYHKKLLSWRFYYRAADAALDSALRDPRFWDPSVYDGDAAFG